MNPVLKFLVFAFAGLAFIVTILLIPAAELMPAQVHEGAWGPGLSPFRSVAVMNAYKSVAESITAGFFPQKDLKQVVDEPQKNGNPGTVRSYEVYAVFLALAMVFAAIAINAVGRTEAEEKLVLPLKK